jgi:uncharacterized protein YqfB (UPF0267 family)
MVLSFQPQFVDQIIKGTKIHSIREDKGNRWKVGSMINFATSVRTKKYNEFKKATVTHIDFVLITQRKAVYINDFRLSKERIEEFAQNDGFESASKFFEFFNDDFTGKIIHWTKVDANGCIDTGSELYNNFWFFGKKGALAFPASTGTPTDSDR